MRASSEVENFCKDLRLHPKILGNGERWFHLTNFPVVAGGIVDLC